MLSNVSELTKNSMNSGWVRFGIRALPAAQQQACDCDISSVVCSLHLLTAECVQDGQINRDSFSAEAGKEMKGFQM